MCVHVAVDYKVTENRAPTDCRPITCDVQARGDGPGDEGIETRWSSQGSFQDSNPRGDGPGDEGIETSFWEEWATNTAFLVAMAPVTRGLKLV